MKKSIFVTLAVVASLCAEAGYKRGELLWSCEFSPADVVKYGIPAFAVKPAAGRNGDGALYVNCPKPGTCKIDVRPDVPIEGMIQIEADVKGLNLTEGPRAFNGPKLMFPSCGPNGRKTFPEIPKEFGSFDWRTGVMVQDIPAGSTDFTCVIGIEAASGAIWVDAVRIYRAVEVDDSEPAVAPFNAAAAKIPRGKFLGTHNPAALRGVMSGHDLSEASLRNLQDWGGNVIRLQIGNLGKHETLDGYYAALEKKLDTEIVDVVRRAWKHGIRSIIDLHQGPGCTASKFASNMIDERFDPKNLVRAWEIIVPKVKDLPGTYAYDILNEPACDPETWKRICLAVMPAVRRLDAKTPFMMESIKHYYEGENVIYSPHYYSPHTLTHFGVGGIGKVRWSYPGYIDGVYWDKEQIRVALKPYIDFQLAHPGTQMLVGEFSCVLWVKGAEKYIRDAIEIFEEYGWSWTYHAYREAGLWDVELDHDANYAIHKYAKPKGDTARKIELVKGLSCNRMAKTMERPVSAGTVVEWDFPRTGNCHEGLPFSDGVTGVLVWGGGNELRLTLGRSDLWDHRGGYPWTPEQSYANIVRLWKAGERDRILSLFKKETPKGEPRNPYMLPLGRVVAKITGGTLKHGTVDTETGLGRIELAEGGAIELAMSKAKRTFAVRCPEGVTVELKSVPSTECSVYEKRLKPLGFEKATVADGASAGEGGFCWNLPNDKPVWVSWKTSGREVCLTTGRGDPKPCEGRAYSDVAADSLAYWERFWRESARICVPDPVVQRLYDYGMYRFGAMTDPEGVPAGLQGPWLEDDRLVPWNGDYHFNINVQECYAPAFRGGHFANLMPLFRMILSWRPRLRENARLFCGIADGYSMPHSVDDRGVCIGGFWTGTIDHASTAWMAAYMFRYVKYAGDVKFLRDDAYDFMKGAMNVYLAMLEEKDGALAIPLGPSPEWKGSDFKLAVGRNPSFQLAACHRLAQDLIAAAKMLGETPDPRWFDVEKRLPAFSLVAPDKDDRSTWNGKSDGGIAIFEGTGLSESHRHHSHMAGIYPFDTIPRRVGENGKMLEATYANWVLRGTGLWTGWCVPWASILQTDRGNPRAAVALLHDWDTYFTDEGHGSHHNAVWEGFTNFRDGRSVMQMDGQCAATTAVLELMAHEINGKTEFFRGCPDEWKDVSFENLALSDGRRVSGRRLNGVVSIRQ